MPSLRALSGLAVALLAGDALAAVCTSDLLIDNFAKYSTHLNSLGYWTSDDGSATSISAASNVLKIKPGTGYFYESIPCTKATTDKYDAVTFKIKGPSGGSLTLEAQSMTSCSSTTYKSDYHYISGLTGQTQTITVPLSVFAATNKDALSSFVWSGWSSGSVEWQISEVKLRCAGGSTSVSASSTVSSSTRSTTASSSSTRSTTSSSSSSTRSTTSSTTSSSSTRSTTSSTTSSSPTSSPSGTCSALLVDDWSSQSRLTFLYYNAMLNPSSDDGTMTSVVVKTGNKMTLTPKNTGSYFYTKLGCLDVSKYTGISFTVNAPAGTKLNVELASSESCGDDDKYSTQSSTELGWTFDGTDKLVSVPFSKFSGINKAKLQTLLFGGLTGAVTFGPIALYCGSTPTAYVVPPPQTTPDPTSTVSAPTGTASAFVVDTFSNQNSNTLGNWHGGDDGMGLVWGSNKLTITSTDADYSFYTQFSGTCRDMTSYTNSYLHIAYSGSTKFTVALQQHNSACDSNKAPFPETWDSLEAARYAKDGNIYIPLSHFNINRQRVIGLAIKSFYSNEPVTLTKIEVVNSVPAGFTIPNKLPSGNLVFACKRPNSFAFAIDDGSPEFAQEVMEIIKSEGIKVTFFTVGAPLDDPSTNLTNVYRSMVSQGHQIALHSYTHPKMESLPSVQAIDWEYEMDIQAVVRHFDGLRTSYFRPPFGNEGARMRQRLARTLNTDSPYLVNWSVDVEDWLYAESATPEKQLDAFRRDVNKGGNLVVMHYLYPSTVGYLRQFIQIAKATGKQLMRVDQCMEDPNAPPL